MGCTQSNSNSSSTTSSKKESSQINTTTVRSVDDHLFEDTPELIITDSLINKIHGKYNIGHIRGSPTDNITNLAAKRIIPQLIVLADKVPVIGSLADITTQFYDYWNDIFYCLDDFKNVKSKFVALIEKIVDRKETIKARIMIDNGKYVQFEKLIKLFVYLTHIYKEVIVFYSTTDQLQKLDDFVYHEKEFLITNSIKRKLHDIANKLVDVNIKISPLLFPDLEASQLRMTMYDEKQAILQSRNTNSIALVKQTHPAELSVEDAIRKLEDIFKQYDIKNIDVESIGSTIKVFMGQKLVRNLLLMSAEVIIIGSLADVTYQFFKLWNNIFDTFHQLKILKSNLEYLITQIVDMKDAIKSDITSNAEKNAIFVQEIKQFVYCVHEFKECILFYSTDIEIQKLEIIINTNTGSSTFTIDNSLKIRWDRALKQMTQSQVNLSALF